MFISLYLHLQHLPSSVFNSSLPGLEVTLLPDRPGEGREEKSKWAGAEHLFFQALSFVLNLAVVAMSRLVLGSSTVQSLNHLCFLLISCFARKDVVQDVRQD